MTTIPASMALVATSVSAAPSNGSSTMASTLSLMNCSIWLICTLTSLVPSAWTSSTSEYLAASSTADFVIEPIQPWSAAGAEKPIVTLSPGSSLPVAAAAGAAGWSVLESSGVLDVQPATTSARAAVVPASAASVNAAGAGVLRT